jgi:hypothetical protein
MISAIAPVIYHEASKGNIARGASTRGLAPAPDGRPGSCSLMTAFGCRSPGSPPAVPKRRRRAAWNVARLGLPLWGHTHNAFGYGSQLAIQEARSLRAV